ncbi:MAG: RNA methyltransferase [Pseudoflavonifractor sp.]|nr:RNA methyltransferase [Pseudoflavonifractor sp.]
MSEITKNMCRMVASLASVKHRRQEGCFVAEGSKCVIDTWGHFTCRHLFATQEWMESNPDIAAASGAIRATAADLSRMSHLSTPADVIAAYEMPVYDIADVNPRETLVVALDRIQDPGNLGTIIRIADWFGIRDIVCSPDTVDVFNPKVIQATMGAISRVRVHYLPLSSYIDSLSGDIPVYGTFLYGTDIYTTPLSDHGVIVMGNEGNGISDDVATRVSRRLLIPPYPAGAETSESLNVGMATAITVAEFRRRQMQSQS